MSARNKFSKVFISYSHRDGDFVNKLITDLNASGVQIWIDKWEIKVGDSLIDRIESGIKENDFIIVVLSQNSIKSNWVKKELNSALMEQLGRRDIKILPVLIERCEVPLFLKELRYADFTINYHQAIADVLHSLTSYPPHFFLETYGHVDLDKIDPIALNMNNEVADLIHDSYHEKEKENKLKVLNKAEVLINKVLSTHPEFKQARCNLGTIQYEKALMFEDEKLLRQSIDTFIQAIDEKEHFTELAVTYYSIGRAYARVAAYYTNVDEKLKIYEQALQYLNLAIETDKTLHFALAWRGDVYKELYKITEKDEDFRRAAESYNEAIKLHPKYSSELEEMKKLNQQMRKKREDEIFTARFFDFALSSRNRK